MSNFVTFTLDQWELALRKALRAVVDRHGFKDVHLKKDKEAKGEHAYQIWMGIGHLYMQIESSIHYGSTVSDSIGDDAIRINLICGLAKGAALPKQSHVKRIDTWEKNLEKRIETIFQTAQALEWCPCGSPKRDFKKRDGTKFYACAGWMHDHHKEYMRAYK